MASSPFPVYLHFQTKVTRLVLQVITAFGSRLVSVEHQVLGELKHNIGPVHIPFTFQHVYLCWTVIKMKKKLLCWPPLEIPLFQAYGYQNCICGSGFGSCYFHQWPSRRQQKTNLKIKCFSTCYFLMVHLHHFSKIKVKRKSQNNRNQGFSYYFCLMIEGSRTRSRSTPLINRSRSIIHRQCCGSASLCCGSASPWCGSWFNFYMMQMRIQIWI